MTTEFALPELGEGVDSADVSRVYVSEGDELQADQNVMELETEKAVAELPCPHAGRVAKVHISEGDTIKVGQTLLTIEEGKAEEQDEESKNEQAEQQQESQGSGEKESAGDKESADESGEQTDSEEEAKSDEGEEDEEEEAAGEDQEKTAQAKQKAQDQGADDESAEKGREDEDEKAQSGSAAAGQKQRGAARGRGESEPPPPPAGPATRRLARQLGVDLDGLQSPGDGRIKQEDVVRAFLESGRTASLLTEPLPDFSKYGAVERQPLNKIARVAADRLAATWRAGPHVTQHGLADITELEAARRKHGARSGDGAAKITITSIAIKAVAGLLKEFPKFNSSFDAQQQELILKKHYHIGVAVDTDHGLLVPVIRDADRKSIRQIAGELIDLAEKARRRELGQDDLQGGTFTISNQGAIGGGEFTPIINYPEVAILGMARARTELRPVDGQPTKRLIQPLSLSYDHRVINGAEAARFIVRLTEILADDFALLVAV